MAQVPTIDEAQQSYDRFRRIASKLNTIVKPTYQTCRELGHMWWQTETERQGALLVRTLECARCTSERVDTIDRFGHLEARRYNYARDYLIGKMRDALDQVVVGKIPANFWRGIAYMEALSNGKAGG